MFPILRFNLIKHLTLWLQLFEVTAIDISTNAIKTYTLKGFKDTRVQDFMIIKNKKYDITLLEKEEPFPWLYPDHNTLQNAAQENSLQ